MPLLSKVRGVHQALAIWRKIWPGLPGGFFVMNFVHFLAGLRFHPPKSAGAVDVAAVGNEENLITIARPDWTDFVIELAVVIACQFAACLPGQALDVLKLTVGKVCDKNVKMSLVRGGNERHMLAIRRKSWFDIYRSARSEPRSLLSLQIK